MATKVEDDIDIEEHDILEHPRVRSLLPDLCIVKDETTDLETPEMATKVEDDIDIEEHDILEHPRVRSLLPDLCIVKDETTDLETPDDITNSASFPDDVLNTAVEHQTIVKSDLSDFVYENCIKEEHSDADLSSDKTRHISLNTSERNLAGDNENLPPYRTVHVPPDDITFKSELNYPINCSQPTEMVEVNNPQMWKVTNAFVNLEDWGPRLHNNPSFCKKCKILFRYINSFLAHDCTVYKQKERDAVDKSPVAVALYDENEQNTTTPSETSPLLDQTDKEKSISDSKQAIDADTLSHRLKSSDYYCCYICSNFVKHRNRIINHMSSCHAVDTGGFTIEPFNPQCRFCSNTNTFKSPKTLRQHIRLAHRKKIREKVNETAFLPGRQNDTQLLIVPKSVLLQCKTCSIHFLSFSDGNLHTKSCPNNKLKMNTWRCHICNRFFESEDQGKHLLQHWLSSEPFTVYFFENKTLDRLLNKCAECETYLHESMFTEHCRAACKREFEKCAFCELDIHSSSINEHDIMHKKLSNNTKFITVEFAKVENCNLEPYIYKDSEAYKSWKVYICAKCGTGIIGARFQLHKCLKLKKKVLCMSCGIVCSRYQHFKYHLKYPRHTIIDLQCFDLDTQEPVTPPFPPFPRCGNCKVHINRKRSEQNHLCKEPYRTCDQCKEKFSDTAYEIHKQYHQYATRMNSSASQTTESPLLPNIPEAIRPSGSSTENVQIPPCRKEKPSNTWNILFQCRTCDVIHDSYDKTVEHCQKHLNNVENDGIIIKECEICRLKFDSTCFDQHVRLHSQKIDSFKIVKYKHELIFDTYWMQPLKKQLKENSYILAESIYVYTRRVKFRLVQDGEPQSTQFKCCKCEKYVSPKSVFFHTLGDCDKNTPGFTCLICKSERFSASEKSHHMSLHDKFDNFRTVYFNEQGDEDFNKELATHLEKIAFKGVPSVQNKFPYYQCESCSLCISFVNSIMYRHKCSKFPKIRCLKCDLLFSSRGYDAHLQLHASIPDLSRDLLTVTKFIPYESEKLVPVVVLKRNMDRYSNYLYQCQTCNGHFCTSAALYSHFVRGCNFKRLSKCDVCQYEFNKANMKIHNYVHHERMNFTRKDFVVQSKVFTKYTKRKQ